MDLPEPGLSRRVRARRDFLIGAGAAVASVGIAGLPAYLWSAGRRARYAQQFPLSGSSSAVGDRSVRILSDEPLRAETPLYLLDEPITPVDAHFVCGAPPSGLHPISPWTVSVNGLVQRPVAFEAGAVPAGFPVVTRPVLLECARNGGAAFGSADGASFAHGGVGNALWTGVPLRFLLQAAGLAPGAQGLVAEGLDGGVGPVIPIGKAMDEGTLLAFAMGGRPLEPRHGGPLRLVLPGWPETSSHKWLVRFRVVPQPGAHTPLPVKSLVTAPLDGARIAAESIARGAAWAGDRAIAAVKLSTDFGATWRPASLDSRGGPHGWTRWQAPLTFAGPGYREIWARAFDSAGQAQPLLPDPASGRNNSVHRIWVIVA